MRRTCLCAFLALAAGVSRSAVTPMDTPLPEGEWTEIECEYSRPRRNVSTQEGEAAEGIYRYGVYVPKGYQSNNMQYACIFVTGGLKKGADASILPGRVKVEGWVIIALHDAMGRDIAVAHAAIMATYDDAVKRLRIRGGFKFAVGGFPAGHMAGLRDFQAMICDPAVLSGLFHTRVTRNRKRAGFALYLPVAEGPKRRGRPAGRGIAATEQLAWELVPNVRFRVEVYEGRAGAVPKRVMDNALTWLERKVWLEAPTDR